MARQQAGSNAVFHYRLHDATQQYGVEFQFSAGYNSTYGWTSSTLSIFTGFNFATSLYIFGGAMCPKYLQLKFNNSTKTADMLYSDDGKTFQIYLSDIAAAQTGFNTNPPANVLLGVKCVNTAQALMHLDWIKFTNP